MAEAVAAPCTESHYRGMETVATIAAWFGLFAFAPMAVLIGAIGIQNLWRLVRGKPLTFTSLRFGGLAIGLVEEASKHMVKAERGQKKINVMLVRRIAQLNHRLNVIEGTKNDG